MFGKNMNKRAHLLIFGGFLLFSAVGRFAWIQTTSITLEESALSPDGKFIAKISSKWSERFFGGVPIEIHDLHIESREGQVVRRVLTEEPWTGWPKDSIMKWDSEGLSLSVTYKVHEALSTQLSVRITQ